MHEKLLDGRGEEWSGWVEKFLEYGWMRKQLDHGDFMFYAHDEKTVGIEVKSVDDLAGRLTDARRELAGLVDNVDIPILLVWGKWLRRSNDVLMSGSNQLTWKHLWNLLQSFQDVGLRFQLATSREHAFERINQLYAYYQKDEHSSTLVRRRADADRRIATLMAIPGISRKIGANLLSTFKDLQAIANATESDLMRCPLVGPSRARFVNSWFRRTEPFR